MAHISYEQWIEKLKLENSFLNFCDQFVFDDLKQAYEEMHPNEHLDNKRGNNNAI